MNKYEKKPLQFDALSVRPDLSKIQTGLQIPVFFARSAVDDREHSQPRTVTDINVLDDLHDPYMLKALLENDSGEKILGLLGQADRIIGCSFQSGRFGLIWYIRGEKKREKQPIELIAHVSRFPITDERSNYLQREYLTLKQLAKLFSSNNKLSEQKKYRIIDPLDIGLVTIEGNNYPLHISPFAHNGELHVNFENVWDEGAFVPSFNYAIPYSDKMMADYERMGQIAQNGGAEYERMLELQMLNLAQANGIIFRLTGRGLHQSINAGDWLTKIDANGSLNLVLSATARGLTQKLSEKEYLNFMARQATSCNWSLGHNFLFKIFAGKKHILKAGLAYADELLSS